MKRHSLVVATLFSVLITAFILIQSEGRQQSNDRAGRRSASTSPSHTAGVFTSPAAWRHRHGSPHHWRDCMLSQ
jgi:hypothetical protein